MVIGRWRVAAGLVALLVLCCCSARDDAQAGLGRVACDFGRAYFNCHYAEAATYVTADSRRWLEYAASNMTQTDVDQLRAAPGDARVEALEVLGDSTMRLLVSNFLCKDTLGRAGHYVDRATFVLTIVDGKVRMVGLPRSERQSPY